MDLGRRTGSESTFSAPKEQQDSAQGFNPGSGIPKRCAQKALRTPRTRGAFRQLAIFQYSKAPSLRVAGFEDEDENEGRSYRDN
jgi:hypothetical protein